MILSHVEFSDQMKRMNEGWPRGNLTTDKSKLIYNMAKPFSGYELKKIVDSFISTRKDMPLPTDFASAFADLREKKHLREKETHRRDSDAFFKSSMHPDEVKHVIQTLIGYMNGKVPRKEFEAICETIKHMAEKELEKKSCQLCIDGLVHATMRTENYVYVFKCTCRLGMQRVESYPAWHDAIAVNFTPIPSYSIGAAAYVN